MSITSSNSRYTYRCAPGFVPLTVLTEVAYCAWQGGCIACPEHKTSYITLYINNEARRNQLTSLVLTFSEVKRVVAFRKSTGMPRRLRYSRVDDNSRWGKSFKSVQPQKRVEMNSLLR